jgi:DNA-damage-inducible protein D
MNKNLAAHHQTFESLRQEEAGSEFWSARKLSKVLEYSEYRHFLPLIEKAKEACENSAHTIVDHFEDIHEKIDIGKGGLFGRISSQEVTRIGTRS